MVVARESSFAASNNSVVVARRADWFRGEKQKNVVSPSGNEESKTEFQSI